MKKTSKLERILPWLVLAAAYLLSVGFFALFGMHNLDADMSAEMIYAQLQNSEGTLLTHNWFYSSEIRTLSPVPFYQLTLALGLSWHAARTLAIALILAGAAVVFLYMARPLGLSANGVYLAAILVLPFSEAYSFAEVYGCMYQPYVAMTFACFGLILRLPREKGRIRRLALLCLLGFWGGTVGVRMLMMCAAPMLLACLCEAFWHAKDCDTLREGLLCDEGIRLGGSLLLCAATLAGYVVNVALLIPAYDFVSYSEAGVAAPSSELVFGQLAGLLEFMGLRESSRMISMRGLASLTAIAVLALCFFCLVVQLLRRKDRLFAFFAFFSLAIGITVNVVTESWFVRYYMAAALMLIVLIDKAWADTPCRLRPLRTLVPLALCGVFFLQSYVHLHEEKRTVPADYELTAQWLLENDLTQGYATFWNSATLTEVTDGEIEIWAMPDSYWQDDWKHLILNDFLQEKRHMDQAPEGRVFVLLSETEALEQNVPYANEEHYFGRTAIGPVYVYDSADALYHTLQ